MKPLSKIDVLNKLATASCIEDLVNKWHRQRPIDQMDTERALRHCRDELESVMAFIREMDWPEKRAVSQTWTPPDSCTCFQGHAPCGWCTREVDLDEQREEAAFQTAEFIKEHGTPNPTKQGAKDG